jgi:hypothetical protein
MGEHIGEFAEVFKGIADLMHHLFVAGEYRGMFYAVFVNGILV